MRAHSMIILLCLGLWGFYPAVDVYGQTDTPHAGDSVPAADNRTKITIGAEPDYPPYSFIDDVGNATGLSVELFQAVAQVMNLDIQIEIAPWNVIKDRLATGELDALPLVGRTPEREELFDFTVPYLSLHGGIVVREDTSDVSELTDLVGRRVAVMEGDNAEEFLRRSELGFDIVTTDTFHDALELLRDGHSDAVVIQRLVALRLLQEGNFSKLRLLDEPIPQFTQEFCFAVTEGDKELLARLNEGLAVIVADGTFRRLQTDWFAPMELPSRPIVVGGDLNYPPFEFINEEGEPDGFNVELIQAIARELDLNVEFRLRPWHQVVGMLERGEIDLIQGMMYSSERDRRFDFSPAHTVHQNVVVARADGATPVPGTVEALSGAVVAVQDGDMMHEFAREHGLTESLVVVDSQEEALRRVAAGEVDYALGSRLTAMYLKEENGWDSLVVGRSQLATHEYGFAVREGNGRLLSYFSEGLAILEESGEYRAMYDRWLGAYVPSRVDAAEVIRTVSLVVTPILLLFAGSLLWVRLLRNEVSRRTAELREREALYRLLSENTLDVIWLVSPDLRIRYINPAIESVAGYDHDEWIGSRVAEHFDRQALRTVVRAVAGAVTARSAAGEFSVETDLITSAGGTVPVSITGTVLRAADGTLEGFQGVARDISERRRYEETLEQSAHRQAWLNGIATVYLSGDETGGLIPHVVEDLASHFRGYHVDYCVIDQSGVLSVECCSASIHEDERADRIVNLQDAPAFLETLQSAGRIAIADVEKDPAAAPLTHTFLADRTSALLMVRVPTDDERQAFLRFRATHPHVWSTHEFLSLEEHANLLALILANEQSRRMMEEANASLGRSLGEKSTLLKEVHHRVKNNLNVIVSLLRLQEDQIDSVESARDAFEQSRNRIFSMALVHESLYQSDSLSEIDMNDYIRDLLKQLGDMSLTGHKIVYELDLEPIRLNISRAIPCGIILNELLTNSIKHAFSEAAHNPTVMISFRRVTDTELELSVHDNGAGVPLGFSVDNASSLGLQLVHLLVAQIDGELEISSDTGTLVVIRLRDDSSVDGYPHRS
ncbi:MAG: transporter substrate-binding domain-containing protein [Alkalispirochaeta sp.]